MATLVSFLVFFLACGAILVASFLGLRLAGQAVNRRRPRAERVRAGVLAALALLAAPVAAAGGFALIGVVLYWAQTHPAPDPQ